ncbi:Uncharacterised protein [Salmonella enterica subsp. enterica serovar Typhimurium]|nr:Uncharacterised protein [Salmonella enterica subsp. enterica serovar Typhimurium]
MAGFLLFWEWKSVAPISGLTSYNEKARFSLAQRPALRRSAAHLWARVNIKCEFEQCSIGGVESISHMVLEGKLSGLVIKKLIEKIAAFRERVKLTVYLCQLFSHFSF